jgi:hypothetical protein
VYKGKEELVWMAAALHPPNPQEDELRDYERSCASGEAFV